MHRIRIGKIKIKEPFSALSHLIGTGFALASLVWLVTAAAQRASLGRVISLAIFGGAMVAVYTASTLYHWLPLRPRQVKLMRSIDQAMIYLMIAGTATPVAMVALNGFARLLMLAVMWSAASLGITLLAIPHIIHRSKMRRIKRSTHATLYLGMGWVSVLFAWPVIKAFSMMALAWLVAGGVSYTVGGLVYALKKPNPLPRVVEFHEVFHLFVMVGSTCHV